MNPKFPQACGQPSHPALHSPIIEDLENTAEIEPWRISKQHNRVMDMESEEKMDGMCWVFNIKVGYNGTPKA